MTDDSPWRYEICVSLAFVTFHFLYLALCVTLLPIQKCVSWLVIALVQGMR